MQAQLQSLEAKAYKLICSIEGLKRELINTEQEILKLRKELENKEESK